MMRQLTCKTMEALYLMFSIAVTTFGEVFLD